MADLYALVYVSTATRALSLEEIGRLLDSARRRNAARGITGVLLYAEGRFMQCLEGPAVDLAHVYDIIRSDPCHYGLIEIVREPLARREFPEWSMAFRVVGSIGAAAPDKQDALLAQRLAQRDAPGSEARARLSSFWTRGSDSIFDDLQDLSRERRSHTSAAAPKRRPGA